MKSGTVEAEFARQEQELTLGFQFKEPINTIRTSTCKWRQYKSDESTILRLM